MVHTDKMEAVGQEHLLYRVPLSSEPKKTGPRCESHARLTHLHTKYIHHGRVAAVEEGTHPSAASNGCLGYRELRAYLFAGAGEGTKKTTA